MKDLKSCLLDHKTYVTSLEVEINERSKVHLQTTCLFLTNCSFFHSFIYPPSHLYIHLSTHSSIYSQVMLTLEQCQIFFDAQKGECNILSSVSFKHLHSSLFYLFIFSIITHHLVHFTTSHNTPSPHPFYSHHTTTP